MFNITWCTYYKMCFLVLWTAKVMYSIYCRYVQVWLIVNGQEMEWNETLCHKCFVPHRESRILKIKILFTFTIEKYYACILLFGTNIEFTVAVSYRNMDGSSDLNWWGFSVKTKNESTRWRNTERIKYRWKMNNWLLREENKIIVISFTDLREIS